MKHQDHSLIESFQHAFDGIAACIKRERNMKIHLAFTGLVIIAGLFFRISTAEWLVCLIFFGLVMGLEVMNTALESAVDLVTEEDRPLAKMAKDAAAGAVLVAAIMAAAAGLIIFVPRFFGLFS